MHVVLLSRQKKKWQIKAMGAAAFNKCSTPKFLLFFMLFLILFFLCSFNVETLNQVITFNFPSSYTQKNGTLPNFRSRNYNPITQLAGCGKKSSSGATSLGRIEEDLAEARAAIHEAIRSRSSTITSDMQQIPNFIPSGSIYKNSFAFHRSHIEMVKRLKIWVYKEGEAPLVHSGPLQDIYAIEGQFIHEMESGESSFLAQHPDQAHMFFLPFSVAQIVHYIYLPITTLHDYSRHRLQHFVTDYIAIVAHKYPYWNRSQGADHFMLACHDWGPDVSLANPELFKNFIRVLSNANMTEGFKPTRDVSLPELFLTYGNLGPPPLGQAPKNRPILAFYAGGPHGFIRELLLKHWKDKDDDVQVYEFVPKGKNYTKLMGLSKFCLCPSGFEVATARLVEAIYQGCIPVIIKNNYSLPFSDVLNWSRFSVQIPVERIPEIKVILRGVSRSAYLRMYKRVKRVRRHFVLNRPAKPFDVIHMILHSLWLRRLNVRLVT